MQDLEEKVSITDTSRLKKLKIAFDYLDLTSEFIEKTEESRVEQILVLLDNETENRAFELIAQIMFLTEAFTLEVPSEAKEPEILQFMISLPIVANEKTMTGIATLILRLNPFLPLGAFGLTDVNTVYYRYNLVSSRTSDFDIPLVFEVLDSMNFFGEIISKAIYDFSTEKNTLDEVLERTLKLFLE